MIDRMSPEVEIAVWAAAYVQGRAAPLPLRHDERGLPYKCTADGVTQGLEHADRVVNELRDFFAKEEREGR